MLGFAIVFLGISAAFAPVLAESREVSFLRVWLEMTALLSVSFALLLSVIHFGFMG